MKTLFRRLSKGFVGLMVLLAMIGLGLWLLGQIVSASGRVGGPAAPVGAVANRFRRFSQTGS